MDFVFLLPKEGEPVIVGRRPSCEIIIADEHISGVHMKLIKNVNNQIILDIYGRNGIYVENEYIANNNHLTLKTPVMIRIYKQKMFISYHHIFLLDNTLPVRSSLAKVDFDNYLFDMAKNYSNSRIFTPTVRNSPSYDLTPIELDLPPARKNIDKQPILLVAGPALTMAVPILLGSGRKVMIIAGIIAAIWASANVLNRRNRLKKEERIRRKKYSEYISECEDIINERYRQIRNVLVFSYPSIDEYLKGGGNVHLIWNRNEEDEDKYYLRVGIGEEKFPVEIKFQKEKFSTIDDSLKYLPSHLKQEYRFIKNVPICIDFRKNCKNAIVTNAVNTSWEIAYSLILQLSLTLNKADMKICVISKNILLINWVAFLPQAWLNDICLVSSEDSFDDIYLKLDEIIEKTYLFTDSELVYDKVLGKGNVTIFYIGDQFDKVSPAVNNIVHITQNFSGLIFPGDFDEKRKNVIFDQVGLQAADSYSRQICALSNHVYDTNKPIPERILLTDLCEYDLTNSNDISRLWKREEDVCSLAVPVGMAEDGRVINLDIDEKSFGPHGLIAGTTGSGKSELLQTYILALASFYPPEKISFFLIDYKGGGMANVFDDLPHVVGMISNLSGATIDRAFVSIRSEIEYRQKCFAKMKVNNIHDYERLNTIEKLPHIIVIIDEFAELKREEPEFLANLVSIAQVGRSLGVHLILSTQKPAGVVDDKIWSNSRFRICLKVRDKMDSNDMLHRGDAAYITNIGRGFLQVGNDEFYSEVQFAYTAAPVGVKSNDKGIYLYDQNLKSIRINDINADENKSDGKLQIDLIKEAIIKAYVDNGEMPVRKLWMDELQDYIIPPDIKTIKIKDFEVPIGLYDYPAKQYVGEYILDLDSSGNIAVPGMPGSGKSTLLMRILYILQEKMDTSLINFYILDFGGNKLKVFEKSRMCGGYISPDTAERIDKLKNFLAEEIKVRTFNKNKALNNSKLLVVIDNYGNMAEYAGENINVEINELIRLSRGLNIQFLISANNIGMGELPNRIFASIDTIISMNLRDKYSYAAAFSAASSVIPTIETVPGRGLLNIDKEILQFQCYIPVDEANETNWNCRITGDIKLRNSNFSTDSIEFPYIPDNPTVEKLSTFFQSQNPPPDVSEIPVGYISETAKIYYIPFNSVSTVLVSGRSRCGRKNLLNVIDYFSNLRGIPTYQIISIEEFYNLILKDVHGIVLCRCLFNALDDFYTCEYSQEIENCICDYLKKNTTNSIFNSMKLVGVIGNRDNARLIGRNIWNSLLEHPYGIVMGGCVDEQNIFDFSYMNYSSMAKRKKAGTGNVAFYEDEIFAGEVVIPLYEV